nr:MAG TPA: hypothetical protein [Bacteriophage sp.]
MLHSDLSLLFLIVYPTQQDLLLHKHSWLQYP